MGVQRLLTTSDKGIAFLERQEGVVLKAYRDVAGVWTIGAGLTAATGVIKPKAGMTITREEASSLLKSVLRNVYEPAVRKAMPRAKPHEFDGGVSFHYNTGGIERASWVNAWIVRQWDGVRSGLLKWVRGGGKLLPGLQRRRLAEYDLMKDGRYGLLSTGRPTASGAAGLAVSLSSLEFARVREMLSSLGYDPGGDRAVILASAVRLFQADHDLSVDGIIGKATLSTLQRRQNARSAAITPAAVTAAGGGAAGGMPVVDAIPAPDWAPWLILGLGLIWLAVTAWRYRDVIAAKIAGVAPAAATYLRKF